MPSSSVHNHLSTKSLWSECNCLAFLADETRLLSASPSVKHASPPKAHLANLGDSLSAPTRKLTKCATFEIARLKSSTIPIFLPDCPALEWAEPVLKTFVVALLNYRTPVPVVFRSLGVLLLDTGLDREASCHLVEKSTTSAYQSRFAWLHVFLGSTPPFAECESGQVLYLCLDRAVRRTAR